MKIASNSSGFYHTPRIGDEVIISFLDNDIDKPFISGSLYNTTNNGKLIVYNVYVGKEDTIDKLSFIPDRDNFDWRVA